MVAKTYHKLEDLCSNQKDDIRMVRDKHGEFLGHRTLATAVPYFAPSVDCLFFLLTNPKPHRLQPSRSRSNRSSRAPSSADLE